MAFIQAISEGEATGLLRELYDAEFNDLGYVPNYSKALSLRPETLEAWNNMLMGVRKKMRLRRYELVTIAAAMALKCTY